MTIKYLSEIIQTIRDRGDYRNPIKFTDAIITKEAQAAFSELYQIIGKTNEGYFDTYATATTRANIPFVALPSDNWIVRAIDISDGAGCFRPLRQVGIDQRNRYGATPGKPCEYRLTSRGADLYPTPDQAYTLRILYTPSAPDLRVPVFVGWANPTFVNDDGDAIGTMTVPDGIAIGDTMFIIVAAASHDALSGPPDGWHSFVDVTSTATSGCVVYRRIADGSESASYTVHTNNTDNRAGMAMLVYRNLDPLMDVVDSDIADVTGSASFTAPILTLSDETDMYLGIAWDSTAETTFTTPFGSVKRFDQAQKADLTTFRQMATFDLQPGTIGDTSAYVMRASDANSGLAAAFAVRVNPFREFYNGWEEYIVYGACIRLSGEEEVRRVDWLEQLGAARAMASTGATGRRSAEPQLIPLMDDGW